MCTKRSQSAAAKSGKRFWGKIVATRCFLMCPEQPQELCPLCRQSKKKKGNMLMCAPHVLRPGPGPSPPCFTWEQSCWKRKERWRGDWESTGLVSKCIEKCIYLLLLSSFQDIKWKHFNFFQSLYPTSWELFHRKIISLLLQLRLRMKLCSDVWFGCRSSRAVHES